MKTEINPLSETDSIIESRAFEVPANTKPVNNKNKYSQSDQKYSIHYNNPAMKAQIDFVDPGKKSDETGRIYCIRAQDPDTEPPQPLLDRLAYALFRFGEIIASLAALIIFLPVMLVIAVIVKMDSPGPVLFFQRRLGKSKIVKRKTDNNGTVAYYHLPKTFWFVKFRTMYVDATERFPKMYDYNYSKSEIETIPFKIENDPRITRAGQWLRASTLDELPNFWNLLKGDMRLVGPRPEIPEMLHNYTPGQMKKFTVKPGITGLPQINGRGRLSFQDTVAFDLEYVDKKSIWLDLKVTFITIFKVITRHGAF